MTVMCQTGVLINTIAKGFDGLSHFAILFTLVFVLFSTVSWWSFAENYDDFKDFPSGTVYHICMHIETLSHYTYMHTYI